MSTLALNYELCDIPLCKHEYKIACFGTSLAVQWLRLHAPNARGMGSIPGWGTKIPPAAQHGQKINKTVDM